MHLQQIIGHSTVACRCIKGLGTFTSLTLGWWVKGGTVICISSFTCPAHQSGSSTIEPGLGCKKVPHSLKTETCGEHSPQHMIASKEVLTFGPQCGIHTLLRQRHILVHEVKGCAGWCHA